MEFVISMDLCAYPNAYNSKTLGLSFLLHNLHHNPPLCIPLLRPALRNLRSNTQTFQPPSFLHRTLDPRRRNTKRNATRQRALHLFAAPAPSRFNSANASFAARTLPSTSCHRSLASLRMSVRNPGSGSAYGPYGCVCSLKSSNGGTSGGWTARKGFIRSS